MNRITETQVSPAEQLLSTLEKATEEWPHTTSVELDAPGAVIAVTTWMAPNGEPHRRCYRAIWPQHIAPRDITREQALTVLASYLERETAAALQLASELMGVSL